MPQADDKLHALISKTCVAHLFLPDFFILVIVSVFLKDFDDIGIQIHSDFHEKRCLFI